jgi:hypothetical protein
VNETPDSIERLSRDTRLPARRTAAEQAVQGRQDSDA